MEHTATKRKDTNMLIPKEIVHLGKLTDQEANRYALSEISIESNGDAVTAVATDGRALLAVTWAKNDGSEYPGANGLDPTSQQDFRLLVSPEALKEAVSKMPKRSPKRILANNIVLECKCDADSRYTLMTNDLDRVRKLESKQREGRYPNWRDSLPVYDKEGTRTVTLSAGILRRLLETIDAITQPEDSDGAKVHFTFGEKTAGIAVKVFHPEMRIEGALQPCEMNEET